MNCLNDFKEYNLGSKSIKIIGGNDIPICTPDLSSLPEEERKKLEELLKIK